MSAPCYACGADHAPHIVDEVWFDFGESNVRFCSSKGLYKEGEVGETPLPAGVALIDARPRACDACKKEKACLLAQTVLFDAHEMGATGPLLPTRWWVRYTDGHVIGGDVALKG